MKITLRFRGSIFNQKEPIQLDLEPESTVLFALIKTTELFPRLEPLLFSNNSVRDDILLFVDQLDVKSMNLLQMPLRAEQIITILPLAHGGFE